MFGRRASLNPVVKTLLLSFLLANLQLSFGPIFAPQVFSETAQATTPEMIQNGLALDINASNLSDRNGLYNPTNSTYTASGGGYYTLSSASSQYLINRTTSVAQGSLNKFSVFMWVYPTAAGQLLSHLGQTTINTGYHTSIIDYTNSDQMIFGLWRSQGGQGTATSTIATPKNNWYHVGLVYDGTKITAYINGASAGTSANFVFTPPANSYFGIGAIDSTIMVQSAGYGNMRFGSLSVYNRDLSGSEVRTNFASTTQRFGPTVSNPSNSSTFVNKRATFSSSACSNTTSGSATCNYGWQLSTDAGTTWNYIADATSFTYTTPVLTSSYNAYSYRLVAWDPGTGSTLADDLYTITSAAILTVSIPPGSDTDTALTFSAGKYAWASDSSELDVTSAITMEAWVYQTSTNAGAWNMVMNKENSYQLGTYGSVWSFGLQGSGGWTGVQTGVSTRLNEWQHVALTRASGSSSANFYLNGQLVWTGTADGAASGNLTNSNQPFTISGRSSDGVTFTSPFVGSIDEVRVFQSARSLSEVVSDMHTYGPINSANLLLYYDFNEGTASRLYNRTSGSSTASDLSIVGSPPWIENVSASTSQAYTVRTFTRSYLTSSGGWKVPSGIPNLSYLVVAGGGAGGASDSSGFQGGGGGGGGVRTGVLTSPNGVIAPVVGLGQIYNGCVQSRGGNSKISGASLTSIEATGGGSGGCYTGASLIAGNSGGSGGGGSSQTFSRSPGSGNVGNYSPVEGFAGGDARSDGTYEDRQGGGGGGGATSAGGAATYVSGTFGVTGNGGTGFVTDISGESLGYGGGGGGGARRNTSGGTATDGGGAGGKQATQGSPGVNGRGGGGGGTSLTSGNNGGSGVIIIRWITATAPIFTGPTYDTLTAGLTETFTVSGSATSPLTRNFRWQVSTDTGTSWSSASQGSGFLTANYVTPTLETTTSGIRYQYRVVVTDSDTAGLFIVDTSTAVYLMINPRNTITSSTGSAIFTQKYGESRTAVFTFAFGTGPRTATVLSTVNNQNGRIAWSNLNSDSATVRVGTGLPVGTYSETLTVTDSVTAFTTQAISITVSKADTITVTTTLSANSVTYNEAPAAITTTQTVTGLVNSETATVTSTYREDPCVYGGSCLASATIPTEAGVYKVGSTFSISSPASLSNYQGVESVTATLTINQARQTAITIGQYLAYPNISSYPLNVYGGSGPGVLTRTLVSAGTAGCTLVGSFILTATSVGTCTVKAEKAGTRNYIVESTTATIYWIAWVDNYASQALSGNNVIPLSGGNQIIVRTETLTASAFSNETGTAISSGQVGTKLRINSTGFSGLSPSDLSVTFRTYEDAVINAVTSTYVEVVIPSGAVTGVIAIDSPRGVAYTQSFTISP